MRAISAVCVILFAMNIALANIKEAHSSSFWQGGGVVLGRNTSFLESASAEDKKEAKDLLTGYFEKSKPAFISALAREIDQVVGDIGVSREKLGQWFDETAAEVVALVNENLIKNKGSTLVDVSDWETRWMPNLSKAIDQNLRNKLKNYVMQTDLSGLSEPQRKKLESVRGQIQMRAAAEMLGRTVPQMAPPPPSRDVGMCNSACDDEFRAGHRQCKGDANCRPLYDILSACKKRCQM
ncbi:hypothetical protein [Azospirillum sp. sgz302134]